MADRVAKFEVLIYSSDPTERERVCAEVQNRVQWTFRNVNTIEDVLSDLEKNDYTVFVWGLTGKTLDTLTLLTELRDRQKNLPIILITDTPSARIFQLTKEHTHIANLERNFTPNQLSFLLSKLEKGELIFQREHKRYATDFLATLKRTQDDSELKGKVLNVSRGGAFMKVPKKLLSLGELVELCVNLKDVSKTHRVFAEIVWMSPQSKVETDCEIGIKFMTPETLYKRYLKL
jgi:Tfp pilus assembly protein PilZ